MGSSHNVRSGFRPEIQGMRAVAVLLVIAYHLYPGRVSGGYVGVDVFFVISGYLITSHLVREAEASSHLSLTRFWARRIRRLLPAALVVLMTCVVLTWVWVPRPLWDQTLRQITASTFYVENWALASDAVDYSAIGNSPTLVQHYWSLSVEEQFYVVWPIVIVAVLLATRRRAALLRVGIMSAVGVLVLVSFAYSVRATAADPAHAYFVTTARVWEFGVGALLGVAGASTERWWRGREPLRVVVGWAGLAGVLWAGLALSDTTAFPGWIAAVPVLATAALIVARSSASPFAVSRALSWRPAVFLGDVSYSMYLWHWPLIVVLPYVTGVGLRPWDKGAIFAATVLLSWASTRWVEDPMRTTRFIADVPWRAYAFGAGGMVVVVAVLGLLRADLDREIQAAQSVSVSAIDRALAHHGPCVGPDALAHRSRCGPPSGDVDPSPDPATVARENTTEVFPGCQSTADETTVRTCTLGARTDPRRTIAIVGDSHATHWFSALDELGRERDWQVRTFSRSSCPFSDARRVQPGETVADRGPLCSQANREVERRLLADPSIDTVFVSDYASAYDWASAPGAEGSDPGVEGFRSAWRPLTDAGKQVVVIRDVPAVKDKINTPDCLAEHPGHPVACALPRSAALTPDLEAVAAAGVPGVRLVDLTPQFCDARLCYAVVGNVIVYRDYSHLSAEYSTLLAPYLARAFDAVDASVR